MLTQVRRIRPGCGSPYPVSVGNGDLTFHRALNQPHDPSIGLPTVRGSHGPRTRLERCLDR